MDGLYPGYGFAAHKGYHAEVHVEALRRLGPCPIHRPSWAPIRRILAGEDPMPAAGLIALGAAPVEPDEDPYVGA